MNIFAGKRKIHKALTDKTIVYESHVRRFWSLARYEEKEKMIYSAVRKKDENGQDVDLEIKFNVGDLRRVLELGDSDDDPTIIPECLCKCLGCRVGFTGHLNGKMGKTMFSKPYKFMIHCVVHALSHRKGAYDETSDYIINIITSLVLNRPYNVSKVIFDYLVENVRAGGSKYIMYPRFFMMMIDDLVKDIQKDDDDDILGLRDMAADTISRLAKGPEPRVRRMICRINNPAYLLQKMMRGATTIPQQRLVDEPVLDPSDVLQKGADLLKQSLESYLNKNEEVAAQKDQSSSVPTGNFKETEPKGVARDNSSDVDDEST
ncbi:hypothetical protein Hanom_Chr10g00894011 [Helianthus anomalus]